MATVISASTAALWVSPPPRALLCSICLDLFRDPSRTPCGHVFCRECVEEWLRHSNSGCPAPGCDARISCRELQRDEFARRLVGELVVRCQFHKIFSESGEEGCSWTGELSDLKDHLKTCGSVLERCAFLGCSEPPLPRWQLKAHEERCAYRPMTCARCGETFPSCREEQHEESCPMAPVECPQRGDGCGASFPRRELLAHRSECPFEGVACPNGGPLCPTVRRGDLAAHLSHSCTRIPCIHRRLGCKFTGRAPEVEAHVGRGPCAFEQMREYIARNEEEKRRLREEAASLRDDLALLRAQLQALAAAGAVAGHPVGPLTLAPAPARPSLRRDLSPPSAAARDLLAVAIGGPARPRGRGPEPAAAGPPYAPPAPFAAPLRRAGAGPGEGPTLAGLRAALESPHLAMPPPPAGAGYGAPGGGPFGPFAAAFDAYGDIRSARAASAGDELSRDVPSLRPASRPSPSRASANAAAGSFLRSLAAASGPNGLFGTAPGLPAAPPLPPPAPAAPAPNPYPPLFGEPPSPPLPPARTAAAAVAAPLPPARHAPPLAGPTASSGSSQPQRGGARPAPPASAPTLQALGTPALGPDWGEEAEPGRPQPAPVSVPVMRGGGSVGRAAGQRRLSDLAFARPLSPPLSHAPAPPPALRPAPNFHMPPAPLLSPRSRLEPDGFRSPARSEGSLGAPESPLGRLFGGLAPPSAFHRPLAARPAWGGPEEDDEEDDEGGGRIDIEGDEEAEEAPPPAARRLSPRSPSPPAPRAAGPPPPAPRARSPQRPPVNSPARAGAAAAPAPAPSAAGTGCPPYAETTARRPPRRRPL